MALSDSYKFPARINDIDNSMSFYRITTMDSESETSLLTRVTGIMEYRKSRQGELTTVADSHSGKGWRYADILDQTTPLVDH